MRYIPISRSARGTVDVPDRPGVRVALRDPAASSFQPDGMTLTSGSVSSTVMANLDFNLASLSFKGTTTYYVLDFVATQHVAAPNPNDPVQFVVEGVGLRIGVGAQSVSGNAQFSLGALAASATLSGAAATTKFAAQLVGVGPNQDSLSFVQTLIRIAGQSLDVDSLQQIGEAFSQMGDYLAASGTQVSPEPIGVILDEGVQVQSAAASYGYALRSIESTYSLLTAQGKGVKSLPPGVERSDAVMAAAYASITGTLDSATPPLSGPKSLATQLDKCGP